MRVAVILLLLAGKMSVPATAQRTTLSVSGFPITFSPTAAQLSTGFVDSPSPITFTVDATAGTTAQRTTIVTIRCEAPCPVSGSKSMSGLNWRRADLALWNAMTTVDAFVESRFVYRNQPLPASNDPWSNSIYWRALVDWTTDAPGTSTYNIVMTLTVTVP